MVLFPKVLTPAVLLAGIVVADAVNDLEAKARPNFEAELAKSTTCSKENLLVRREWGDLSADERKEYIRAVLCITESPSKLPAAKYPGAKTRYDDFVAIHMKNTLSIHGTGNFLSWHRYYTWAYEQALRNECGYTGAQPYWDWGRWAEDPEGSPIFDGSDISMSGNGERIQHKGQSFAPAGNGGGCVQSGPFKNFTVNLGPVAAATDPAPQRNPQADGFGYNPRCLRRDISNYLTSRYAKTSDIANLISNNADMQSFQTAMEMTGGTGFGAPAGMGVHGTGHFTIAGDPGSDFYCSPGDPAFWLHHGMIDRTWTIWQNQDPSKRYLTIWGGTSMMGGGAPQTFDDRIDLDVLAEKVYPIRNLVSTTSGPFCYIYE